MQSDQSSRPEGFLIDFNNDKNNLDGNVPAPPGPGFAAYPQPPPLPIMPQPPANIPFNYPPQIPFNNYPGPSNNFPGPSNNNNTNNNGGGGGGMSAFSNNVPSAPFSYNYNIPPSSSQQPEKKDLNVNFLSVSAKSLHSLSNMHEFFFVFYQCRTMLRRRKRMIQCLRRTRRSVLTIIFR